MWIFLVFHSHIFTVVSMNALTAPVGGNVTFHCSHLMARGNIKYFCRDSCAVENILIKTNAGANPTRRGRYTIHDKGSDFTVTITDLRLSDSATYICAVERLLIDTYTYGTRLHVFQENKGTSMTKRSTADSSPETMHRSALSDPLVYVGAGLAALVLIFTIVLFIFIKLKQKRRSSGLTSSSHRPDSLTHTSPDASAQSDRLDYSSVQFIRKPRCSVKTCEMFEMNPNERAETLYSAAVTQHQSDITDPNSVLYSSLRKGL